MNFGEWIFSPLYTTVFNFCPPISPKTHSYLALRNKDYWLLYVSALRRCMKDEGRPLEVGLQELASNHLKLHWSRAIVVSVKEKARQDKTLSGEDQGDEYK